MKKIARKILISLPKRFDMKIRTIEEIQDIITIKMDELIWSLQTFEMTIHDRNRKKNKSIVFVSNIEYDEDKCDTKEKSSWAISLLGRKFNKALKRLYKRRRTNIKDKVSDNFKNIGPQHKSEEEDKPNKGNGVIYHEYEGFDHIKVECPTVLKKRKMGMSITWSDSHDESKEEISNKVMAFTGRYEYGSESIDEKIIDEELTYTSNFCTISGRKYAW